MKKTKEIKPMRLGAIITTGVGLILTISSIQQISYLWLIGTIPLTIIGILLFTNIGRKK